MGISTPTARAIDLSPSDAYEYDRLAAALLDEALFEYDHFVAVDRRRVNAAQWRHWRQDDDITVYRERSDSNGDLSHDPTTTSESTSTSSSSSSPSPRSAGFNSHHRGATPRILAVGSLANTLDDVLYGVVTPSAATMRLRAAYTTTDDYVDGAVLASIRSPSPHDPFQFLGLKWLLQRGNNLGLVRPQDFVFLESTGVQVRQDGSGQRVGFHIMHSVELPSSMNPLLTSTRVQRGAFSTCYLYHELANGAVDVYMTAVVQPRGHVLASMAGRAAAAMLSSNWRALTLFAENKKLAWLLETHRQLQETTPSTGDPVLVHNASRCALCAKSFKGFTNVAKKKTACQLCSLTVCGHCTVTRTLRHEGVARGSVVATEMQFCKKCVATAGEESASEIARQQLWESEIVRTGRQHTQTALAIARRETVRATSTRGRNLHALGLSMERDLAEDAFLAMQDTMGSGNQQQHMKPPVHAKMSVSSDRRRTLNGTWNSSARNTDSLSMGTLNCRTSWFQDPSQPNANPMQDALSEAGRASTTSSALIVMDDRVQVTRRMKALDYLPASHQDDTASAIVARSSLASSSMYTEAQDFEVESVYSQTSSIAVLDLAQSSGGHRGFESSSTRRASTQPLTITESEEETQEPVSELEAFYRAQQRQQKMQQQQLAQRQRQQLAQAQQMQMHQRQSHHQSQQQQQYQQPQPPQRRGPQARRSTMILLDPTQQQSQQRDSMQQHTRSSRVRFDSSQDPASDVRDSELLPGRPSMSPSVAPSVMTSSASVDEQRLSYQMQLWMTMNDLRDTAESAYQITQRNSEAIAEQHPQLLHNMREIVAQKAKARRQQQREQRTTGLHKPPLSTTKAGASFSFSSQQPTPIKLAPRTSTPVRY